MYVFSHTVLHFFLNSPTILKILTWNTGSFRIFARIFLQYSQSILSVCKNCPYFWIVINGIQNSSHFSWLIKGCATQFQTNPVNAVFSKTFSTFCPSTHADHTVPVVLDQSRCIKSTNSIPVSWDFRGCRWEEGHSHNALTSALPTNGYHTVYPAKYVPVFIDFFSVSAIIVLMILIWFICHILQGYFTETGAILWLPQCQRGG